MEKENAGKKRNHRRLIETAVPSGAAFLYPKTGGNKTKPPEGFLISHSVPICRTGEQEYLPREIGVEEEKRPIITVLKELRSQSEITGMWTNITDEDIEKADDTIQDPNEGMPGMGGMFDAPGGDGNGPEDGESQKHDKQQEPGKPAHKEVPKSTMDAARKDKGTWVTINGSKVLVKNNIVVGGASGKLNGMRVDESKTAGNNCDKNNGRIIHIGFNENKPLFRPESTTPGHDSHHANHAIKMGLTIKQWLAKGATILNEEPAPYYLDWTEEGKEGEPDIYYRFNKKTGI